MTLIASPTPGITALLRHARLVAIECHSGEPATVTNLRRWGDSMRSAVIAQVFAGLWKEFGVTELAHISGLRVEVVLGNELSGEPPLKINWDFSRTKLPNLVVENARPEEPS